MPPCLGINCFLMIFALQESKFIQCIFTNKVNVFRCFVFNCFFSLKETIFLDVFPLKAMQEGFELITYNDLKSLKYFILPRE